MNNPEHLTYSIDKNKLRIGAALGVIVITAGFALGSVMHTSSSSANEPAAPVTDDTAIGNESDQTTNNTSSVSNDQPVADKESVATETNQTQADETDEIEAEEAEVEETADETEAEVDTDESDEAEAEEAEVDESDTDESDEAEAEEADADDSDETETENDDDGNDDDNSNGFGWDFGLVLPDNLPENLIDPLPLPDDLGPIGPIGPPSPGI